MGEVLYSTKWIKYSTLPRATTQNTTTTHNNQHVPPPPYPSAALALSLHGNIRHGPKSWRRCSLWAHGRRAASGVRSPSSAPLFGVPKRNPSKNRETGGALALGGRRFLNTHNNQMEVGVHGGGGIGEEARWAGSAWGDLVPSFGAMN
jgi:hypothetical protein